MADCADLGYNVYQTACVAVERGIMDISCAECGSYSVTATMEPDEDGFTEYRCEDCGAYFVAAVSPCAECEDEKYQVEAIEIVRRATGYLPVELDDRMHCLTKALVGEIAKGLRVAAGGDM